MASSSATTQFTKNTLLFSTYFEPLCAKFWWNWQIKSLTASLVENKMLKNRLSYHGCSLVYSHAPSWITWQHAFQLPQCLKGEGKCTKKKQRKVYILATLLVYPHRRSYSKILVTMWLLLIFYRGSIFYKGVNFINRAYKYSYWLIIEQPGCSDSF